MKLALSHFLNSKHNIKKATVKKKERNRMVLALKKKKVNGTETQPINKPTHLFTKLIYSKDQFIYKNGVKSIH